MNVQNIFNIRDSRGLDTYEKNFLYTVASRGEAGMWCEWVRNSADMGMKKDRYYKTRKSLVDKELITAKMQKQGPTIYKINDDVLASWLSYHSATQNEDSATQNDILPHRNRHSVTPEQKENIKINNNKNKKENTTSVADAPSVSPNKDDVDVTPAAPGPAVSLIGSNELEDSLMEKKDEAGPIEETHPEGPRQRAAKGSSSLNVIREWKKVDRESQNNNFGLTSQMSGSRREAAVQELTKVVDQATLAGRLRNDWTDSLFEEAVEKMLDRSFESRAIKMDTRAYQAYTRVGWDALEW